uniref:Monooxygenase FAD-binding protein n=1 Tax=Racemicystis crocea TaxID=1707966 RepID=A0A3S7V0L6_9BACT|nr:monooxygenase FAD-binding protein [Racemicystis crocea]
MTLDIGIIGCGTAGSAAALFLSRAGHRVTVYERVPDPGPVGAGIMLQPTGQYVLSRLGLLDRVLTRGARIDALQCVNSRGRTILDLSYEEVQPGLFGVGIHRGALFEALFDAVRAARVDLRLGQAIEDLAPEGARRWLVSPEGERFGPHDLVVVADGAKSRLRDDTRMTKHIRPYRWGALWFVAKDEERAFRGALRQVVEGTQTMLGLLPTGLGPGTGHTPVVSMFWSVRGDRADELRGPGFQAWKREALRLWPGSGPVLSQIRDGSDLLFSAYHRVTMPRWHEGPVVYLGDAGHAMSPQLGQGANLALFDAVVLADELAREENVDRALAAYSQARKHHLRFYQLATWGLTPFFQSDYRVLGPLRDVFMGMMTRVRPLRLVMAQSMVGIKQGILRSSLALPEPPKALSPAV